MRIVSYIVLLFCLPMTILAQDPHFSQFFMAPQFINPALVGNHSGNWELMSNVRQQWGNAGTPFNTETFAGDVKLTGKEKNENMLAAGFALMSDQSMNGAYRSMYLTGSLSYQVQLSDFSRLGIGFQGNYANRKIDYDKLVFGEQFTSGGFDVTLPSGETAISNMKPYFSIGTGFLFNYNKENFNLDIGLSAFHLNKPKQSFLIDGNEFLPVRYVSHVNMEFKLSDALVLDVNNVVMQQAKPAYFAVGGALGRDISVGDGISVFYAGGWFREGDSFYPYLGWLKGNLQIGLTYDITHSKQIQGPSVPKTFELSVVIKNNKLHPGTIPCPWK